jgi:hypothetical protein
MRYSSHRFQYLGIVIILFLAALATSRAGAQEPACPPGFDWQRMSGVGCVQSDCFDIPNAKLSYTSACICQDGYKDCSEPVDYEGFDRSLCGPNCPSSTLVACVPLDAPCPGEESSLTSGGGSKSDEETDDSRSRDEDFSSDSGDGFEEFVEILEELVTGTNRPSTGSEGQQAAGAVTATGLLTAWVLINLLSGTDLSSLLGQLFGGGSPGGPGGVQAAQTPPLSGIGAVGVPSSLSAAQTPGTGAGQTATGKPAPQGPTQGGPIPQGEWVEALGDKFQETVKEAVKDGWYVRNPTWYQQIWNNFPISSTLIETLRGLKGGQCGEMAANGQKWIQKWAEQTYGPGVVVDQIWIGESSSRYPEGFSGAADALYQDNHVANRVILPNGDSYVIDFWDGIIQFRDHGDAAIQNIKPVPENEWIHKWRGAIETSGDPADICNLNSLQESLRAHVASFDARHPSFAAASSTENYLENQRLVDQAIQDWRNSNPNLSPEIKDTIINNWRKNGSMWGMHRPDPPLDPASAVAEAYYSVSSGN